MIWIVLTLIIIVISWICLNNSKPKKSLPNNVIEPPLVNGYPVVGIIFQIKVSLYHYFEKLTEKYGPFYQVKMGYNNLLVINNYEWFKKCFKDDADNFSGRYMNNVFRKITQDCGIITTEGDNWKTLRSFTLRVLRDFGLGKAKSLEIVQGECDKLLEELEKNKNKAIDFAETIPIYTLNIISNFLMSKRYEREDKDVKFIQSFIEQTISLRQPIQILNIAYPFLEKIDCLTNIMYILFRKTIDIDRLHKIFQDEIDEHRKYIDEKSEDENLIDRFLMEQKLVMGKSGDALGAFKDFQLVRCAFELYIAGYETTSNTLVWAMMFLARYPECQQKMFEEIQDVIGLDKRVEMSDRKHLHYTQAVMDEIMRLNSVAPVAIYHRTFNDTIVDDKYFIAGNTLVVPNIYACCRDPQTWTKPNQFYPDHFLKWSNDTNSFQYNPREELVVFGLGKRQCLGESLARMEYFIFLISIIQKYKVEFPQDITQQDYEKNLLSTDTFIRSSFLKDFKFTCR